MKKIFLIILLLPFIGYCQKKIDPTPEDISKAKELRSLYDEEDIVLLESDNLITFSIEDNKVAVNNYTKEHLMNINSRSDIQKPVFYDGESEIQKFQFYYRNKKEARILSKDVSYTDNDLFHNDARVKYANVDFPTQGYTYFFESIKHTKDIKYFTSVYFTSEYPSVSRKIVVEIPDWLNVELFEKNFENFDIQKTEEQVGDKKIITYTTANIEAYYDENSSPGPSYIYPHVLLLAKDFTNKGEKQILFNETKDLYTWYKSLTEDISHESELLNEKVTALTKDATTDEEKIKNIYYWIQDNIRYIAFEDGIAGFKPDSAESVLTKRYGDCKGMANLAKEMLVIAGFDARLTWIGTKRIAYNYSTPSLAVDNHMICTLFKDGKKIFLDPTEKFSAFGEYAERIQGKQSMIENKDSFLLEEVPTSTSKKNKEYFLFNASIVNEEIEGQASRKYQGESRADFLYNFNNLESNKKQEALKDYLARNNRNIFISDIETSNLENREAEIDVKYVLKHNKAVSSFDNEMYIDLDFYKEFDNYTFEERQTNYNFAYKKDVITEMRLKIPESYTVSALPESFSVDNANFKISISLQKETDFIVYKKEFEIKNATITTSDFEAWNDAITKLNAIYNEQIILTKS
ncbi:transglutaminase-like domain-containing protein [Lacinutrix himadriensis]|uniref:transglutaminase-like domain-containing protein n=1 Tax=Lacinutrix himadriensis TaxID=641549 RepID=UPI0006E46C8D|nr:transglutaminase domain-containing protein [Lacinutrix himadriensis]